MDRLNWPEHAARHAQLSAGIMRTRSSQNVADASRARISWTSCASFSLLGNVILLLFPGWGLPFEVGLGSAIRLMQSPRAPMSIQPSTSIIITQV